jgi:PadR family transcriptional regulator, regulatory protein AphA
MSSARSARRPPAAEQLSAPAYVVLGMVRLGARSGYEIKQAVELSIRFFWTLSHAQIYPSLELLERSGLVRGHPDPRGRRPRRVYEITGAGEHALREWLRREDPIPFELRDLGLVKLFFADALDRADTLLLLDAIKRRSEDRVKTLQRIQPAGEEAADEGNALPLLTLRMGIAVHQAMVDVCREFEQRLAH